MYHRSYLLWSPVIIQYLKNASKARLHDFTVDSRVDHALGIRCKSDPDVNSAETKVEPEM